jgi:hypothetical protein
MVKRIREDLVREVGIMECAPAAGYVILSVKLLHL